MREYLPNKSINLPNWCLVWFCFVWFSLVWFGLVEFGSVWFSLAYVRFPSVLFGPSGLGCRHERCRLERCPLERCREGSEGPVLMASAQGWWRGPRAGAEGPGLVVRGGWGSLGELGVVWGSLG